MTMQKIKAELVETHSAIRQHCHVCGGMTERVHVVARVKTGPYEGFTICETCLEDGDVARRMLKEAEKLETFARNLREAAPNIEFPTFEEWKAANDTEEREVVKWYEEEEAERKRLTDLAANHPRPSELIPF